MIDPRSRWRGGEKPDYAGLLTWGGLPYTEDPAELAGVDVAIIGAPFDDLVSDRPGARFGPRAIRGASWGPGMHLEAKVDALTELRVVDFGDAPVVPADARRSHEVIQATVAELRAKGVEIRGEPEDKGFGIGVPIVLPGGVEMLLYEPRHATALDL